jgi:hypothetical protein
MSSGKFKGLRFWSNHSTRTVDSQHALFIGLGTRNSNKTINKLQLTTHVLAYDIIYQANKQLHPFHLLYLGVTLYVESIYKNETMCAVLVTQPAVAHYLNNTQPTTFVTSMEDHLVFISPIDHTFSATDHTCISCTRGHRILTQGCH